ncbi:Os08g0476400 [Oryza sativa Japonica Group]|uniref:Os08g0476400 protein n=2 Tax=Oryza TaxID=4527 RepID=C7J5G9_ORYSJ|nr:Os08g0476400 [Oryza sativa Japonica Group]|eukprot:NP_001175626.1 Os08g0476400 [Oryza sativa Japonica Group]
MPTCLPPPPRAAIAAVLTSLLPPPPGASASLAPAGPAAAVARQIRRNDGHHPGAAVGMSSASVAERERESEAGEFTEVVVVRHGETAWNASRIIQVPCSVPPAPSPIYFSEALVFNFGEKLWLGKLGRINDSLVVHLFLGHLDVELNEIGRQQAVAVWYDIFQIAVVFDPALRERHIGDLQGLKYEDAGKEKPEAYRAFLSHKRNRQIPGGGESLDQLSERCVSCLYNIVEKHQGERIILVSHGGTIRELYRHASPMKPLHGKIHNTSVSVILVSGATGRCIVKACGDISHLKETGVLENAFGGDKNSA